MEGKVVDGGGAALEVGPQGGQAFCYRDKSKAVHEGLSRFFNKQVFSDLVVVNPDGAKIHCHQLVLSACSRRFAEMLDQGCLTGGELPVRGVDSFGLYLVIRFFYTGECHMDYSSVIPVYDAAHRLDVPGLAAACDVYSQQVLRPDTASSLLQQALRFNMLDYAASCSRIIRNSFDAVVLSDDFLTIDMGTLKRILEDNMPHNNDGSIFRAAWRWGMSSVARMQDMPKVFGVVKVPNLSMKDLVTLAGPLPSPVPTPRAHLAYPDFMSHSRAGGSNDAATPLARLREAQESLVNYMLGGMDLVQAVGLTVQQYGSGDVEPAPFAAACLMLGSGAPTAHDSPPMLSSLEAGQPHTQESSGLPRLFGRPHLSCPQQHGFTHRINSTRSHPATSPAMPATAWHPLQQPHDFPNLAEVEVANSFAASGGRPEHGMDGGHEVDGMQVKAGHPVQRLHGEHELACPNGGATVDEVAGPPRRSALSKGAATRGSGGGSAGPNGSVGSGGSVSGAIMARAGDSADRGGGQDHEGQAESFAAPQQQLLDAIKMLNPGPVVLVFGGQGLSNTGHKAAMARLATTAAAQARSAPAAEHPTCMVENCTQPHQEGNQRCREGGQRRKRDRPDEEAASCVAVCTPLALAAAVNAGITKGGAPSQNPAEQLAPSPCGWADHNADPPGTSAPSRRVSMKGGVQGPHGADMADSSSGGGMPPATKDVGAGGGSAGTQPSGPPVSPVRRTQAQQQNDTSALAGGTTRSLAQQPHGRPLQQQRMLPLQHVHFKEQQPQAQPSFGAKQEQGGSPAAAPRQPANPLPRQPLPTSQPGRRQRQPVLQLQSTANGQGASLVAVGTASVPLTRVILSTVPLTAAGGNSTTAPVPVIQLAPPREPPRLFSQQGPAPQVPAPQQPPQQTAPPDALNRRSSAPSHMSTTTPTPAQQQQQLRMPRFHSGGGMAAPRAGDAGSLPPSSGALSCGAAPNPQQQGHHQTPLQGPTQQLPPRERQPDLRAQADGWWAHQQWPNGGANQQAAQHVSQQLHQETGATVYGRAPNAPPASQLPPSGPIEAPGPRQVGRLEPGAHALHLHSTQQQVVQQLQDLRSHVSTSPEAGQQQQDGPGGAFAGPAGQQLAGDFHGASLFPADGQQQRQHERQHGERQDLQQHPLFGNCVTAPPLVSPYGMAGLGSNTTQPPLLNGGAADAYQQQHQQPLLPPPQQHQQHFHQLQQPVRAASGGQVEWNLEIRTNRHLPAPSCFPNTHFTSTPPAAAAGASAEGGQGPMCTTAIPAPAGATTPSGNAAISSFGNQLGRVNFGRDLRISVNDSLGESPLGLVTPYSIGLFDSGLISPNTELFNMFNANGGEDTMGPMLDMLAQGESAYDDTANTNALAGHYRQ